MMNRRTLRKQQSATGNRQLIRTNNFMPVACCLLLIAFAACSPTKHIPEGDALYTGASVNLTADSVDGRQLKVLKADLQGLTRPNPNSRFLGIPFKLMIYNFFNADSSTSFFGKLGKKFGEPPVLASSVDLDANVELLESHLHNKGFFGGTVRADSNWDGKKASVTYTANGGAQYKMASVEYVNDSSRLGQAIVDISNESLLQIGAPYDLDLIKGERTRIDAMLKERGFYYFNPDNVLAQVDSTIGQHKVAVKMIVKPETPPQAKEVYYINNVYIYSDYSLNTARSDTSLANAQYFAGYNVIDPRGKYKPKLFRDIMLFSPNEVYNRTDHNKTLQRLMNLNVFKFVRNRFERAPVDSPKLNTYYYLTPFPEKALRAEVGANTKSNNLNGSEVSIGFRHRNAFRGGEQLDLRLYAGTEAQFSGSFQGTSTFRLGGELNFAIPRFVTPFLRFNPRTSFVPRTNIQLGYEALNRRTLYTLNSFRAGLGYLWKQSIRTSHEFYPIAITYVQPLNITETFKRERDVNPTLQHITDTQFVLGATYQFNYNEQAGGLQKRNSFFLNFLSDISGNVAGLLTSKNAMGNKELFGLPFSQYAKFEADGRWYRKLGLDMVWANRVVVGLGLPYGNSRQLPYIKQFFTGGNNSIRAFRSRTVGPGSYLPQPTAQGFIPDQTGDIKLELNTELRPRISGPLYGALFVDAGNIWLANSDPNKPGATFDGDFLKELAVGAGVGIRLDIQLFVIRLDVAFPVRRPWLPQGERMAKGIALNEAVYNLAIGYPF
jgi:outer membrane protein assembly factor BamA